MEDPERLASASASVPVPVPVPVSTPVPILVYSWPLLMQMLFAAR